MKSNTKKSNSAEAKYPSLIADAKQPKLSPKTKRACRHIGRILANLADGEISLIGAASLVQMFIDQIVIAEHVAARRKRSAK